MKAFIKSLSASLVVGATALTLTTAVSAASVTLRFGHLGAEDTAYQEGAVKFQQLVRQYSDNDIDVQIFPNGVLGDEGELFEQQIAGVLDASIINPGKITDFSETANIFSFPFLYRDAAHWNSVLSGDLGKEISHRIHAESGVTVIGYFGGGKRQIVSNKPLNSLDDLQGMKVRVNPTDPLIEAWSALGAQPTTFAWKEIYTGLQLGAIDGLLNEPEWIYRMRFHEVAPHIGLSEHDITVRLMTLSGKALDKLSATQQTAVNRAAAEASAYARQIQLKLDAKSEADLVAEGAILYPLDRVEMKRRVQAPLLAVAKKMELDDLYLRIQQAE
ncbi:C4-dicarboxylate ABC transporter substrate-binding protein [Marinobacterium aestuarii]|uniref:C4-dicarboxylate ABC transporter substrate-binding protein n=1 Tax=Marinobacterium aestuarii TaxID=1821621 RepID=A0A1A9EW85_9GAMM|nr:TRAP transporter substrate-binding protein [Marinobacterium aestuarii]ANG62176.1 C4-dicarboxylate ABC transporter substrate-binding protein [Marinobacterium aestuarii]